MFPEFRGQSINPICAYQPKSESFSINVYTISLPLELSHRQATHSYTQLCPILPHSDLPPRIPSGFKLLIEVIKEQYMSHFFTYLLLPTRTALIDHQ